MPEQATKYVTEEMERRAKERQQKKYKDKETYNNYKSHAEKFVTDYADETDLQGLKELIERELKKL